MTVSTRRYETTRNEVSKMKKFIQTNEEIVAKQDAEIRRLASLIRRMDDDVGLRRPSMNRFGPRRATGDRRRPSRSGRSTIL